MTQTIPNPRSPRRVRLIALASLAGTALVMGVAPSLASAGADQPRIQSAAAGRKAAKQDPNRGTLNTAARRALHRGYLVPHEAQYRRQKARAARLADARRALTEPLKAPFAPSIISGRSWQGINEPTHAPPDETSAVGTTRYIQLVNSRYAIYNKTSNAPISQNSLDALVGAATSDSVFDPQIIWDPDTNRFYFAADRVVSDTDNRIAFGFSKTASPSSAADWCKYQVPTGPVFYDYPKLGDSRFFAIIGSNRFSSSGSFIGSDLLAISKPPAGSTCPGASTFKSGEQTVLRMTNSNPAFTPVPANEIDTNSTGWAVSRSGNLPATKLGLFKVTRASNGLPVIQANATQLTVPSYTVPADVPQKGSNNKIDSNDSRPTQAVAAVDSGRNGKFAIWTQHTTKGGAGAQVRWYEINPAANALFQKGTATNSSLFEFNGAISPNRQVNGTTKKGGNAMLMNFNTSSAATFPAIKMVSKIGSGAQSGQIAVKTGTTLSGFDCSRVKDTGSCRWGDYAAATPDPSTANRIWNVSQFGAGSGSGTGGLATSRTWHFVAKP